MIARKLDAFAGIEIEDQAIGMIEIVGSRAPWMNFERRRLHQCHQPIERIDAEDRLLFVRIVDLQDVSSMPAQGCFWKKPPCAMPFGQRKSTSGRPTRCFSIIGQTIA